MDASKRKSNPNPRATASPLSLLTFWWMKDLFLLGMKKDLEVDDLYDTLEGDLSEELGCRLEENWKKEVVKAKKHQKKKPSLGNAISRTFYLQYALQGILVGFQIIVLSTARPVLLRHLLQYFASDATLTKEDAFYYAGLLLGVITLNLFMIHHSALIAQRIGMRIRVACCSLIYRKIVRLSKTAVGQTAAGKMINLLSNDVSRFDILPFFLHFFWIVPVELVVSMYFSWQFVGWASMIGIIGLFVQTMPVQTIMTKLSTKFRLKVAVKTDERVRLMNEIISGIQVIKMYAWEKPFEMMVEKARRNEVRELRGASYVRGLNLAFMLFTERTTLYITVVAYALLGNAITADRVFGLAQFYNILQLCMAIGFPQAVQWLAEARVSISRIEEFLILDEYVQKQHISYFDNEIDIKSEKGEKTGILIKKASAKWIDSSNSETLINVSLNVKLRKLCAIIGPVGSGKSSLLHAILGELPLTSGSIDIKGTISYASQEPWLFAGTIRQNILFGEMYEPKKYREVVKSCALIRDFELFPNGDLTIVGERGVSLSGGQRARINLARAVYRDADIYLLDDPLSAVDTHVGKHLFQQCINGYLSTKTRILATHQLQYLKDADLIVILKNGKVEDQGAFNDISVNKTDFGNLLGSNQEEDEISPPPPRLLLKKQLSVASVYSSLADEDDDHLMEEPGETTEMIAKGELKNSLYKDYFTSGSSNFLLFFFVLVFVISQLSSSGADYWVTYWTTQEQLRMEIVNGEKAMVNQVFLSTQSNHNASSAVLSNNSFLQDFWHNNTYNNISYTMNDSFKQPINELFVNMLNINMSTESPMTEDNLINASNFYTRDEYIIIYTFCIIACIFFTVLRSFVFFKVTMNSSQQLHNGMFNSILQGSMRFFNSNPSGSVLNRFSKDMGSIDELLPRALLDALQIMFLMVGILTMVVVVNYQFLIVILIIGPLFYKMRNMYLQTVQDVKRLEGVTRSPVFSYISASLHGITTIRSSSAEIMVIKEFDNLQDLHTSSWFTTIAANSAFGFYLDSISTMFVSAVILSFLTISTDEMGGFVGLAISQSLGLTGLLQYGIRQTTEVVTQMTAVERVLQYRDIDKESPFVSEPGKKPPIQWPQKGAIKFDNVSLRYSPMDPPVLRNLTFSVQAGHKVGIVGRTGAGKSSLIVAIFRLANLEGAIFVDNINTQTIGLNDLRKRISIIPQEPVLFTATIRYNLDPFQEYPDHKIWEALEEVELKEAVQSLDDHVNEGGSNFSVGQRQLICLARAILRNNRILVLDEATANVDPQTDNLIQVTIRSKFKNCTVLTIAHRLNTIMDSDRVLVMDSGTVVEYAHPHELLRNSEGYFSKMVQQTGSSMATHLSNVAEEYYKRSQVGNGGQEEADLQE